MMNLFDFVNNHPIIALLMLWAVCDCIADVVRSIADRKKTENKEEDKKELDKN